MAKEYHDLLCWLPLVPHNFSNGPLICVKTGEISQWSIKNSSSTAIVCLIEQVSFGGRTYQAIHNAAGPELQKAYSSLPIVVPWSRCSFGEAKITGGYNLPASYVIHTVGPTHGSRANPTESLRTLYRCCLTLAKERNIQYVAFPDFSCGGAYSYPVEEAATTALSIVKEEFASDFKQVHFLFQSDDVCNVWTSKGRQLLWGDHSYFN